MSKLCKRLLFFFSHDLSFWHREEMITFWKQNTLAKGGCMVLNFAAMMTDFFMIWNYIWGFNATIRYSFEWHWKVIYNMPGWSSIRIQENLWAGGVFRSPSGLLVFNASYPEELLQPPSSDFHSKRETAVHRSCYIFIQPLGCLLYGLSSNWMPASADFISKYIYTHTFANMNISSIYIYQYAATAHVPSAASLFTRIFFHCWQTQNLSMLHLCIINRI